RKSLYLPDFSGDFTRKLYGTFLTYLDTADFAYDLEQKHDARGCLVEFVKSHSFGQIFISRTHPGITRGNHYHHTKAEKFLVVEGEAIIRFRLVRGGAVIEYRVNGQDLRVVDIPPGYTHSIENVGGGELVTLFWSPEVFNPSRIDTNTMPVIP
ncbi:MAG: capsular polysaccharide biosynthesis protein CapF, partial [Kiritimatiellae bacterium]|nr:capsular polysaccharide biosynthesis protein CapF [Kiritimatiellia bacterium]